MIDTDFKIGYKGEVAVLKMVNNNRFLKICRDYKYLIDKTCDLIYKLNKLS